MADTPDVPVSASELEPCNISQATLMRVAQVQTDVKALQKRVSRIDANINGNGDPGIKTKIDRLEIWQANKIWLERAVIAAVAGLIVNALVGQ